MPAAHRCCLKLLLLVAMLGAGGAYAQNYPARSVRILTSGAGGNPDLQARMVATEFTSRLGQPFVVENRPSGVVLGSAVAKAAPDGHTLLVWGGAMWLESLFAEVPYDPIRDFAAIATLTRSPNVLVVHPSLPVKTVSDLVKLAKERPGVFNYSSSSNGSSTHIAWELFKSMSGTDIVRVTYKGGPQEMIDLLSGQIQMTFLSGANVAPLVKTGKLRALASGSAQRSVLLPDLPALGETLPGFVSESLLALWATGKTPDPIIRRLNLETLRLLEKPDVRDKLLATGSEPVGGTPEQLTEAIRAELDRVGRLVKGAAVKQDS